MQIKIPRAVVRVWNRVLDWVNVPIWQRENWEIRRIDIVSALGFVMCVAWYSYEWGWRGAILGGLMYAFTAMVALWLAM